MKRSRIYKQMVAASVVIATANPVLADGGDLVGGLIGGMIGAAIINGQQQQQRGTQTVRRAQPSMSAEERARNVEVQTALNHFAFPVGRPDGVLGRR